MTRNIVWKGLDSDTMEFCRIISGESIRETSCIVGCSEEVAFKTDYQLELSGDWVVRTVHLKLWLGDVVQEIHLEHNGSGKWTSRGKPLGHLDGCVDIDITLTPFTNSLPVNRLLPQPQECVHIDVAYIDVIRFEISRRTQHYTAVAAHTYHFSHDHDDFTADIIMDDDHLVTRYPQLFERIYAGT